MGLRGVEPLTSRLSGNVTTKRERTTSRGVTPYERTPAPDETPKPGDFVRQPYPYRTLRQAGGTRAVAA